MYHVIYVSFQKSNSLTLLMLNDEMYITTGAGTSSTFVHFNYKPTQLKKYTQKNKL